MTITHSRLDENGNWQRIEPYLMSWKRALWCMVLINRLRAAVREAADHPPV